MYLRCMVYRVILWLSQQRESGIRGNSQDGGEVGQPKIGRKAVQDEASVEITVHFVLGILSVRVNSSQEGQ